MRALVVTAHPEAGSYTAAMARAAAEGLAAAGADITLADLAARGFEPRMQAGELAGQGRPIAEIDELLAADVLVLVYPVWWGGPPAQLKGWLDRVLAEGIAWHPPRREGLPVRPGLERLRGVGAFACAGAAWPIPLLQGGHPAAMARRLARLSLPGAVRQSACLASVHAAGEQRRARHLEIVAARAARLSRPA